MNAKALIEFKKASLGYGGHPVLEGVDLSISSGAFVGILGPNGAGKTTLLKTLLGLLAPVRGKFSARGSELGRPRYGYVPQKEKLDPIYPLSSYEVAAMGSFRRWVFPGDPRDARRRQLVRRCLRECGALELADLRYSDLSGGQRQRVLIARALASEPELLVLDEPLAGIDAATQKALLELFQGFKDDRRLTVLMVSHRVQAERKLFTDVAWVDEGKVEFGAAEAILSKKHVSSFFGHSP